MNWSYYEKVAAYLDQYRYDLDWDLVPPSPIWIREAISVLIYKDVLTKDEMKREALRDFDVVLADNLFLME